MSSPPSASVGTYPTISFRCISRSRSSGSKTRPVLNFFTSCPNALQKCTDWLGVRIKDWWRTFHFHSVCFYINWIFIRMYSCIIYMYVYFFKWPMCSLTNMSIKERTPLIFTCTGHHQSLESLPIRWVTVLSFVFLWFSVILLIIYFWEIVTWHIL